MNQVICPLDKQPCERGCPDRYADAPAGGCFLTTAQGLGAQICYLVEGTVGLLFSPDSEKAPASAANADEGKVEQVQPDSTSHDTRETEDFQV